MSCRRGGSRLFSTTTYSWLLWGLLACLLGNSVRAAEPKAPLDPLNELAYRQIFVPADSPESWPVGAERYLPIPYSQFSQLVGRLPSQNSTPQQAPIHFSQAVSRAVVLQDDLLHGTTELIVSLPSKEPRLLPLAPANFTIQSAKWHHDSTQEAQVGLWKREDNALELAVLANHSDTLHLQWQLTARYVDSERADFYLKIPVVVPHTFEILLPKDRSAALSHAELIRMESDPSGKTRWVYQLAARESRRLRIKRLAPARVARPQPLVSQTTSYQLETSGLEVMTRLRLDARETQAEDLRAVVSSGLRVVEATIDRQPVLWRVVDRAGEKLLVIPRPASGQPQSVEIRCLAKFRSEKVWQLPKLRFQEVAWTEGTTSLHVSSDLELRLLTPQQATLRHIVGIASDTAEGEVFRLQEWSPDSVVEVLVGRAQPHLSARTATTLELGHNEAQASMVAMLSSSGGEAYQVQATIATGWSIDSVTTTPVTSLNDWHTDRGEKPSKLYLQLNEPLSREKPLRIEIKAHETTGQPVLPATIGQLELLSFDQTDTRRQLLQLRTGPSKQGVLSNRLEQARLEPAEFPPEFREIDPEVSVGTLLDISDLKETEVVEFHRQPAQFEANVQIEVHAFDETFKQRYQIDYRLFSGTITKLVLELEEPLPENLSWQIEGQPTLPAIQQIKATTQEDAQSNAVRVTLQLPIPMTNDFRLQASYSQPAQPQEQCNLLRLPRGVDWKGQAVLRGSLEGIRVRDQGWTPTVHSTNGANADKANGESLPVLGTYRLGLEEGRRELDSPRLQLLRQDSETPAPQMIAWLAEHRTLQAASGAALHVASYSLENLGREEAEVVLPKGAELQEAWLDNQQLEPMQISSEGNTYRFQFDRSQRWPYLTLHFSTHEPPLSGSATVQPVVPECSFPVNRARWTLWAPEQYEIDSTAQEYSSQRYPWWKRIFGPLARSREETVFNPLKIEGWTELWSEPLVGQQTKQTAERLARLLAAQLETEPDQTVGNLWFDLAEQNQLANLIWVDRAALLAKGIQANSLARQLRAPNRTSRLPNAQALPLSSHRLALLVRPGTILLTSSERVAHWHDQLRPTESPGVFLVSSDALAESLDKLRGSRSSDIVGITQWKNASSAQNLPWNNLSATTLDDLGRRAQTVEFVDSLPTLVVRRAFVQQALWYALLLLTLVLGVWQLAHFPNGMILTAAVAGAACLLVPAQWLTIPQAVFLGLVAAAVVRIVLRSSPLEKDRTNPLSHLARTLAVFCLCGHLLQNSGAQAQPLLVPRAITEVQQALPRVLIPIDAHGVRQGKDVYLPTEFLEKLRLPPPRLLNDGAELVVLAAKYRGSLPSEATGEIADEIATESSALTDPWTLRWKVESFVPNTRFVLPLRRDEARWSEAEHRLDGLPVQLQWQHEGNGCAVLLSETGTHWLHLVVQPKIAITGGVSKVRLHVPPLPDASLDLTLNSNTENLRVSKATHNATTTPGEQRQYLLEASDTLDLQWTSKTVNNHNATWTRLDQLAWLHVDPASARLEVQLSIFGYQAASRLLDIELPAQLQLIPPDPDSPVAEVLSRAPSYPTRIRLKLRPGLPTDFVLSLRFEVQREVAVGRIFFPRIRLQGIPPTQNLFAVSVAAGLSYDQQLSGKVRTIEPAEFTSYWNTPLELPLFAYALGPKDPDWSLHVRPDPQSFTAQQTLRIRCLPNGAKVDFEATIDNLTGPMLSHRIEVPQRLQIDSITVQDQAESNSVALRWARVHETEVALFLGRPLREAYSLKLLGRVRATPEGEAELPQIQLLGGIRDEIHADLFRTDEVRVSWTSPLLAPKEIPGQRISRSKEEIHLGQYSWRSSERGELSSLRIESNDQDYQTTSVTRVDLGPAGWLASLNSRILVRRGVLSRITMKAPENFRGPFVLQPEQVGVLGEAIETPYGKQIPVRLAQPLAEGEELEVRLQGNLSLSADQRLVVPALQWKRATRRERFVVLPTVVEGESIEWRTSGLRPQKLPPSLRAYVPQLETTQAYHVEQSPFKAEERSYRGTLRNARIRYARAIGMIDADGLLTTTAELVLQPGHATSCRIQLPAQARLRQLVVGDAPVRRELLEDGSWKVPLGPPFMPQRIVVSYRSLPKRQGPRLRLVPPKILLENQALPAPQTWWCLRTGEKLQFNNPEVGRLVEAVRFAEESYRLPVAVLKDSLSQALKLSRAEGLAWSQVWQSAIQQAESELHAFALSDVEAAQLAKATETRERFTTALAAGESTTPSLEKSLSYPPRLPNFFTASTSHTERFFVSDEKGQLLLTLSSGVQRNLWQGFAAAALVFGILAIVLRLRHRPDWHHELCRWPHSLALAGGATWWLLLKPSALGMLVVALTLTSLAIKLGRSFRRSKLRSSETQLVLPTN